VLRILKDRGLLDTLAFKGGTAIRKLFLGGQGASALTSTSARSAISTRRASSLELAGALLRADVLRRDVLGALA
jgi:hypothetical protein